MPIELHRTPFRDRTRLRCRLSLHRYIYHDVQFIRLWGGIAPRMTLRCSDCGHESLAA